jgi:hypothetical protein
MEPKSAWPSTSTLRLLVVVELATGVFYIVVSFLSKPYLPETLRNYLEVQDRVGAAGWGWVPTAIGFLILMTHLVAAGGILALWPPARPVFLGSIVATLLFTLYSGPMVASGPAQTLNEAALVLSGVIVGLLYASPLSALFDRSGRSVQAPQKR